MGGHNHQKVVRNIRICLESDGGWCVLDGDAPEYLCDINGNTSFTSYTDAVDALVHNFSIELAEESYSERACNE